MCIRDRNLAAFGAFAGVNVLAALVLVAVLTRVFVPVNALLMATHARGSFSFEDGRGRAKAGAGARSPFRAMLAKEARLLLATPIYLLNGCMGYVPVSYTHLDVYKRQRVLQYASSVRSHESRAPQPLSLTLRTTCEHKKVMACI